MALRALLLSSTLFLLVGCSSNKARLVLQESDPELKEKRGKFFYKGKIISAEVLVKNDFGDSLFYSTIQHGLQEGEAIYFYPKNIRKEIRFFENGLKEGVHTGWWENGKQKFSYSFENDVYEGEVIEWYESGAVFKKFHYHLGVEDGIQQAWKSDGRIKASYEVVNGRTYGNTGTKNCENVGAAVL